MPSPSEDTGPESSVFAEKEVLAALLCSPVRVADALAAGLGESDFYLERHALIWRAMVHLYDRDGAFDPVVLVQQLRDAGHWDRIGGAGEMQRLLDRMGTDSQLTKYVGIVVEKASMRRLIETVRDVEAECFRAGVTYEHARQFADDRLLSAVRQDVAEHVVGSEESMDRTLTPGRLKKRIPSGIVALDMLTGGLPEGKVTVVGGRPGMGKSSFGVGVVAHHLALDVPTSVYFVTAEMPLEEVHCLLLAALSGRTFDDVAEQIECGKLTGDVEEAVQRIRHSQMVTDESSAPTPLEIVRRAKVIADGPRGLKLLVIDYWQNLTHKRERGEDSTIPAQERGIHALTVFAKDTGCVVVLLTQLTKAAENRRPSMADVRWCDKLVADAGMVIFPHRPRYRDGERSWTTEPAEIAVDKNRGGPTGVANVTWEGERRRYV